ncbi:MAG TPA: phytanoyl-CoA dioxygenase family protein [Caulobacteraceae bacterium]
MYGETDVGWCAATPPNETTDEAGNLVVRDRGFSAADPRAPRRRVYDDPEVCALRDRLSRDNGIIGLEILSPDETERAARVFLRDGFVVVRDVLINEQLERFRDASARALAAILAFPGVDGRKYVTETARLPHRYSFGTSSVSRQLLHDPVWASMVELPTTRPLLAAIFGGEDYCVNGAGGDLCLPGAIEYQALHADVRETFEMPQGRVEQAKRLGIKIDDNGDLSHATAQLIIERTSPHITINFLLSEQTALNGPIRHIPGTQARPGRPPTQAEEPDWMRLSTLVGAPAGAAVFRDNRAWHGATPNLSREVRAMPNVEYSPAWVGDHAFKPSMPHEVWASLSHHAQRISRRIKTEPGVWPAGAGAVHPLAARRAELKVTS